MELIFEWTNESISFQLKPVQAMLVFEFLDRGYKVYKVGIISVERKVFAFWPNIELAFSHFI